MGQSASTEDISSRDDEESKREINGKDKEIEELRLKIKNLESSTSTNSDDKKSEYDSGDLIRSTIEAQRKYMKNIKEFKEKQSVENYLYVVESTINFDPKPFASLENGVDMIVDFNNLIKHLRATGSLGSKEYETEISQLLSLFHREWKLLHKTMLVLKKTGFECEACQMAIKLWRMELSKVNPETPDTKTIKNGFETLTKWLTNRPDIKELVQDWTNLMEDIQHFEQTWIRIKHNLVNAINCKKDKVKTNFQRLMDLGHVSLVCHSAIVVLLGVACTTGGLPMPLQHLQQLQLQLQGILIPAAIVSTVSSPNAYVVKHNQNPEVDKEKDKRLHVLESVSNELSKDVAIIRDQCEKLDLNMEDQEDLLKIITTLECATQQENQFYAKIQCQEKLVELFRKFGQYQRLCNQTAKVIAEKKKRIVE